MKGFKVLSAAAVAAVALLVPPASQGTHGPTGACAHPTIVVGNEGETVYGTAGPDMIRGGNGSDTIYGGRGHDRICGGSGPDRVYGQRGEIERSATMRPTCS